MRIAVLDDDLNASPNQADWNRLNGRAEITVSQKPFSDF
jgi:hypothetical protein